VTTLATTRSCLTLEAFRDRHAGAHVIICGCGVSLAGFQPPDGIPIIGVNDVGRLFDPDYLVVVNDPRTFSEGRFTHVVRSQASAIFSHLDLPVDASRLVRFRLGSYAGLKTPLPGTLHYTRNSPYVAVGLAILMGARRIGLIGVDFTDHHFFATDGPHPLAREIDRIDAEYGRLAEAAGAKGIELLNLSEVSRLASLPKQRITDFLNSRPSFSGGMRQRIAKKSKVYVERGRPGPVGDFLDAFAASAAALGHTVERSPVLAFQEPNAISVVWNGRRHRKAGQTIYCEHGWLPRSAYQVSHSGINADSHIAPFAWDGLPLDALEEAKLKRRFSDLRAASAPIGAAALSSLPERFLLVPLQMEYDTNIQQHAPSRLRRMQDFVDFVSAARPPLPIVFKQHPADERRDGQHLRLQTRRAQDLLWPHNRGSVHALMGTRRCRGIISINSNVIHDGLIWDVPAIALGRNVWPMLADGPFLTRLPADWLELEDHLNASRVVACRNAYADYLIRNQWTLEDVRDPMRVARLFEGPTAVNPPLYTQVLNASAARPTRTEAWLNVFAENRGWRFEELKSHFARRAATRGILLRTSERPLKDASAWICLRAREAGAAPDLGRTVVQIHDLFSADAYRPSGERELAGHCGALHLTHPYQAAILAEAGIVRPSTRLPCRPLGAVPALVPRHSLAGAFTVAWIGRPEVHQGSETQRPNLLASALKSFGPRCQVALLGERLDSIAADLRGSGFEVRLYCPRQWPLSRWPEIYALFDVVLITAERDAGPAPLFDALAAGVPVVSTRVGWAPNLLIPGENGFLCDDVEEIVPALENLAADRSGWLCRANTIRNTVAGLTLDSWIDEDIDLALALTIPDRRRI
jgi:glycosyltransferase involved in cell wall biosynthesis